MIILFSEIFLAFKKKEWNTQPSQIYNYISNLTMFLSDTNKSQNKKRLNI